MERRALLAVVLSILVLGIWQAFVAPPLPRSHTAPGVEANEPVTPPSPDPLQAAGEGVSEGPEEASPPPDAVAAEAQREFIVETATYSVRFDNRGGRILSWRLLRFEDDLGTPQEMVLRELPPGGEFPFRLAVVGDEAATERLDSALFREEVREADPADEWPGGGFQGQVVSFRWADGQGLEAVKKLALPAEGYVGHAAAEVIRNGQPAEMRLTWAVGLPEPHDAKTKHYWKAIGQGIAHAGGKVARFDPAKTASIVQLAASQGGGSILWGGLESTYFTSLLLPDEPGEANLSFVPLPAAPVAGGSPEAKPLLAARFEGKGQARFSTVVGPKDYDLLSRTGRELELAIDFSRYSLIYVLTKYLYLALRWINTYVGNYGFSIILLTIVLRAGFFPLMYRSSISMRQNAKKMQKIQPKVKAIQERYRKMKRTVESQRKMNDEVMGIYKKEGMNPMGSLGGCLPLFIQMPFFLAFYNLLSVTIEMRGAPFVFWVRDLSRMDPWYVLPILMGASWMVQQAMTSSSIPDPMQRRIMGLMPLMFTFMMLNMPSGLVLYWLMSNLLGLGQQYIINRQADKQPA